MHKKDVKWHMKSFQGKRQNKRQKSKKDHCWRLFNSFMIKTYWWSDFGACNGRDIQTALDSFRERPNTSSGILHFTLLKITCRFSVRISYIANRERYSARQPIFDVSFKAILRVKMLRVNRFSSYPRLWFLVQASQSEPDFSEREHLENKINKRAVF